MSGIHRIYRFIWDGVSRNPIMAKAQLTFKDIGITVTVPISVRVIEISE